MNEPTGLDAGRRQFVQTFAQTWADAGQSMMDGRVLGFLLVMDEDYISSADLGKALSASPGSISVSTRRMLDTALIRRHWIPGDRNHYFAAQPDPWGSFLAYGFEPTSRIRAAIRSAEDLLPDLGRASLERVENSLDYFDWLESRKVTLVAEWEEYKKSREVKGVARPAGEDNQRFG